ncbi:type II restriction endonuclease [Fusibacter sp. 3D3]|uniref:type II restriction endonuclease n=1 Tax=Fusibacter sp. 3D3 TaxID=1048380 RepID=UPI000855671B|nr:type II restriction endonuclease [Fusibacter sp. 3D3]GAU78927.1 restriction endonuclease-related protein [Fusibacter sp. 3D3]
MKGKLKMSYDIHVSISEAELVYCKFLSANDVGLTGGHQSGPYVAKSAVSILFDKPCSKGTNITKTVEIKWHDDSKTISNFKYYGTGTRNEYRITSFGRGFPHFRTSNIGSLFILCKMDLETYRGYVIEEETEIDAFLDYYGLSPAETNALLTVNDSISVETQVQQFLDQITGDFPSSAEIALKARSVFETMPQRGNLADSDMMLINWLKHEYLLFKEIEKKFNQDILEVKFQSIDAFINRANSVLNRRKSRAGKSLENHLAEIFRRNALRFVDQGITEQNKRPDFLFPDEGTYWDAVSTFDYENLAMLASKTTCKDRWRQILTEADKIEVKHLFTLQQGISANQLNEMKNQKVQLVVPKQYISTYPMAYRDWIWDLSKFISFIKEKQND